jgi:hypothetical protein
MQLGGCDGKIPNCLPIVSAGDGRSRLGLKEKALLARPRDSQEKALRVRVRGPQDWYK